MGQILLERLRWINILAIPAQAKANVGVCFLKHLTRTEERRQTGGHGLSPPQTFHQRLSLIWVWWFASEPDLHAFEINALTVQHSQSEDLIQSQRHADHLNDHPNKNTAKPAMCEWCYSSSPWRMMRWRATFCRNWRVCKTFDLEKPHVMVWLDKHVTTAYFTVKMWISDIFDAFQLQNTILRSIKLLFFLLTEIKFPRDL